MKASEAKQISDRNNPSNLNNIFEKIEEKASKGRYYISILGVMDEKDMLSLRELGYSVSVSEEDYRPNYLYTISWA